METAKDKAKSLVEIFIVAGCLFSNAVECAKIAVDEIRKELNEGFFEINEMNLGLRPTGYIEIRLEYWQEVKNELNKM